MIRFNTALTLLTVLILSCSTCFAGDGYLDYCDTTLPPMIGGTGPGGQTTQYDIQTFNSQQLLNWQYQQQRRRNQETIDSYNRRQENYNKFLDDVRRRGRENTRQMLQ